jgi:hypothetical protein
VVFCEDASRARKDNSPPQFEHTAQVRTRSAQTNRHGQARQPEKVKAVAVHKAMKKGEEKKSLNARKTLAIFRDRCYTIFRCD